MNIQAVLKTYGELMTEIKLRHKVFSDLIANHRRYPPSVVMELTQLQIRMISETLALGCLVAHGDIEAARSGRLTRAYKADEIMNGLEKLHPYFYPRPTKQIVEDGLVVRLEDIHDGYLTKDELVASYRRAGNFLHVGDLEDLLSRKPRPFDLNSVVAWGAKLVALLNHHNIYLIDPPERRRVSPEGKPIPTRQIIGLMNGTNGEVQTTLFHVRERKR